MLIWNRYWSPYPFTEVEDELFAVTAPHSGTNGTSQPLSEVPPGTERSTPLPTGPLRKAMNTHSRTSDLLAGSLARGGVGMERGSLWVCDMCFKYMMDAPSWEAHTVREILLLLFLDTVGWNSCWVGQKKCSLTHPPGRKVYQRGALVIWEIDGAKAKVCSLHGIV
jgi:hypothetical protein